MYILIPIWFATGFVQFAHTHTHTHTNRGRCKFAIYHRGHWQIWLITNFDLCWHSFLIQQSTYAVHTPQEYMHRAITFCSVFKLYLMWKHLMDLKTIWHSILFHTKQIPKLYVFDSYQTVFFRFIMYMEVSKLEYHVLYTTPLTGLHRNHFVIATSQRDDVTL